jgi:uncharacterized protein (TIGR02145 family)
MMSIRIRVLTVMTATCMTLGSIGGVAAGQPSAKAQKASGGISSKRMPDGKEWAMENLNVDTAGSFCHGDDEQNCRRYGRLYTWDSAQVACPSLGDGWRLPTNEDWQQLANAYGGIRSDLPDSGKEAFTALMIGGSSGFGALLGGNRDVSGEYARLEAHGIYWTSSSDPGGLWFYNFGRGGQFLNRHHGGNKQMAFSVRCIKE